MNFTLKPFNRLNDIKKTSIAKNLINNSQNSTTNLSQLQRQNHAIKQKSSLRLFSKLKNKKQDQNKQSPQKQQKSNQYNKKICSLNMNLEDSIQKQKMLNTRATNHNESVNNESSFINISPQRILKDQIQRFKIIKAHQIADIAIKGQIQIDKVMKRILPKLQQDLYECIKNIFELENSKNHVESGTKKVTIKSSPKQLGSTIEHTFTPKTISTPGIQFNSNSGYGTQVNEFSIRQTQFTLGNQSSTKKKSPKQEQKDKKKYKFEEKKVSQFSLNLLQQKKVPLSKKIKEKIMNNSKKSKQYAEQN